MLVDAGASIDVPTMDESGTGLMGSDEDRMEHLGKMVEWQMISLYVEKSKLKE